MQLECGGVMYEYRLYRVDSLGHVAGTPECFSCESDEAAIERARQAVDGHDMELWQLDRLVIRLESQAKKRPCPSA
jgi:hypothetical protein